MSQSHNWGKFTAKGSQKVESLITRMAEEIVDSIQKVIPEKEYKCLYMLGGYGRGEGGVVVVNGQERPHNNFDLMLVSSDSSSGKIDDLKIRMDDAIKELPGRFGIGIDTSVISASKLKSSSCRIIWYDMRFGHKLLMGNHDIIESCSQFKVSNIPAWDARNLLVNRGTLMIINDLLLERKNLTPELKKVLIKHKVKSIIGYGDCLLYALGDYDWSYLEKQERMNKRSDIDPEFKKLYDDAMNFRFQPDYEPYLELDIKQWLINSRELMKDINLTCESRRLHRKKLSWDSYIDTAIGHGVKEGGFGVKAWGKRLLNYSQTDSDYPGKAPSKVKLGYKFLGERGILPLIYPLIVYNLRNKEYRSVARSFLQVQSFDFVALRTAYLRKWGEFMDTNFSNLLDKYDIKL